MSIRAVVLLGTLTVTAACSPDALPSRSDAVRDGSITDAGAIEGRYEMRIATMLDGTSRTSHHVKTPEGVFEFVLEQLDPLARPEYDSWVRLPGALGLDGRWEADELTVVAPPPQPLIDPVFRDPRRIGTVLVFWGQGGLPNGEAAQSMYSGNRSTNVYYGENSYGIETMAGKVFGPYEIEEVQNCNVDQVVTRGEAGARARLDAELDARALVPDTLPDPWPQTLTQLLSPISEARSW